MAGPGRGRTVHGEQRRHARDGGMLDISPFTQPTRNTRLDRISVCRPRHNMLHGPTWGASAAQSRRAPYWRPTRQVGAAGVLHHWHLQLWGAVAKRSARRRREASLESSQRHERPDWQSSSLLHVG